MNFSENSWNSLVGKIHGGQNRIEDPVGKRPVYGKKDPRHLPDHNE